MKVIHLILFVIFYIIINPSNAGTCPKYPLIRDFDFHMYTGMWYQQDKQQAGWEAPGRCWKSLYIRDKKTGQYKMKMIFSNTITGRTESYDSQLTLLGPVKPSIIKYTIPLTFMEDTFQVLATDYTTFSVEYKCNSNGILEKRESVYLLTREKNPSPLDLQRAYAIMHRYGIDLRKLERVDQTCGGIELAEEEFNYDYYDDQPEQLIEYQQQQQQQPQQGSESGSESQFLPHYYDYETEVKAKPNQPIRKSNSRVGQRRRPDKRLTMGQSLATRLWHVLHS